MAKFNFKFTIETSSKTSPKVEIYETTVNPKDVKFQNGFETTNKKLARYMQRYINALLEAMNDEDTEPFVHISN